MQAFYSILEWNYFFFFLYLQIAILIIVFCKGMVVLNSLNRMYILLSTRILFLWCIIRILVSPWKLPSFATAFGKVAYKSTESAFCIFSRARFQVFLLKCITISEAFLLSNRIKIFPTRFLLVISDTMYICSSCSGRIDILYGSGSCILSVEFPQLSWDQLLHLFLLSCL